MTYVACSAPNWGVLLVMMVASLGVIANIGYFRAALLNDASAQYELGLSAQATNQPEKALPWFERAANLGHKEALAELANMYLLGEGGLVRDALRARRYFEEAASRGDKDAMMMTAILYENERLGTDYARAVRWYGEAMRLGVPEATASLKRIANLHRNELDPELNAWLDSLSK